MRYVVVVLSAKQVCVYTYGTNHGEETQRETIEHNSKARVKDINQTYFGHFRPGGPQVEGGERSHRYSDGRGNEPSNGSGRA